MPSPSRPSGSRARLDRASASDAAGRRRQRRFAAAFVLLAALGAAVACRLFYVQVWDAANLEQKARKARSSSANLYNRGRILDRNGVILAEDTFLYDLYAHPRYFFKASPYQVAAALAPALAMPANLPFERVAGLLSQPADQFPTIRLARDLPRAVIDRIQSARVVLPLKHPKTGLPLTDDQGRPLTRRIPIPGMDIAKKPVRNYPQGTLAGHLLGYVNDEADISAGVEWSARDILKKPPQGLGVAELDGKGGVMNLDKVNLEMVLREPKAEDAHLTIDSRIQFVAERELAAGIARSKALRGAVIMLNPQTGEILAFAVWPTYDPLHFGKTSAETLKNWAVTDVYPPGSTMKIITVACGLETGVVRPDSRILDTGRMKIGGWTIENYDYYRRPHPGMIDLVSLFEHSSNIGSAKISMMMPKEPQYNLLRAFGMGKRTGVDLPGESRGILLPISEWSESTHANIGFGYGLAATPLQMAAGVAAIANHGIWNMPYIIANRHQRVQRRVISAQTADSLTDLLRQSIDRQKTSTVRLEGVSVAGKTGTSRKPVEGGRGYTNQRFTSFIGYYPAEAPRALMMVVIDSPTMAESWGSTVAGPIFKAIADETMPYLGINPAKLSQKSIERKLPKL
ncbi:MAG: penicillin-binding protein 2 [Vampirovibrionales bacterium]|nr:penicillin-binding protein 2 [Vampirovibrionales bacterium]